MGCGCVFFFQAEDGIRDAQESRGLGDVYKRQGVLLRRGDRRVVPGIVDDLGGDLGLTDVVHEEVRLSLIHI